MNDLEYNPNASAELAEKIEASKHDQQKWKKKATKVIDKNEGAAALKLMREQLEKTKNEK